MTATLASFPFMHPAYAALQMDCMDNSTTVTLFYVQSVCVCVCVCMCLIYPDPSLFGICRLPQLSFYLYNSIPEIITILHALWQGNVGAVGRIGRGNRTAGHENGEVTKTPLYRGRVVVWQTTAAEADLIADEATHRPSLYKLIDVLPEPLDSATSADQITGGGATVADEQSSGGQPYCTQGPELDRLAAFTQPV